MTEDEQKRGAWATDPRVKHRKSNQLFPVKALVRALAGRAAAAKP
jgi:hypothetical protein